VNLAYGNGQEAFVQQADNAIITGCEDVADSWVIKASLDSPEAFVYLFNRHFDAIYGYLIRRVGPDIGNDLASEVFTQAFACRDHYDLGRQDAAPWLYGICTNLLRRHHRSEQRRLRAYARAVASASTADAPSLSLDPKLAAGLMSMKQVDREVLLLHAWADLDYAGIAAALSIPLGTVRSRLNRARRQMQTVTAREPSSIEEDNHG
jgi:RNA polymerase sigma-70 factor (ECF subfamily)